MKLFLGLLIIVGGYYAALCKSTDLVAGQLTGMQRQYSSVAGTADTWQTGDTSTNFVSNN